MASWEGFFDMHMARPDAPRVRPVEKVAAKAREAMKHQPVNAVNVLATIAHNRVLSKTLQPFAESVLFSGGLSRRQVELAVLRIGWNCGAVYEFGQHTMLARSAGLSDDQIYLTTRPISEGAWTDGEQTILQVVDDLYADDCVSETTWARAVEYFNESDMMHLMLTAGCYRMVGAVLNSCGVPRDDGVPGWPRG